MGIAEEPSCMQQRPNRLASFVHAPKGALPSDVGEWALSRCWGTTAWVTLGRAATAAGL
jgi:hypothetical protein